MKARRKNRIVEAFEILGSASQKDLLSHKEEGKRAYERLRQLYTIPASQPPDSPAPSPGPDPHPFPDNIKLLIRLQRKYETIKKYARKRPEEAVCRTCSWLEDDFRVVDIHVANGNRTPTNEERFVKQLAFLNLAREYNVWELDHYRNSTLNQLKTGNTTSKTTGHISAFTRDKAFSKPRTIQSGIQHGLRLLHVEAKAGRSAITAFLALADCPLSWLDHPAVEDFIGLVKGSGALWKLVEDKSAWFDRCQSLYQDAGRHWEREKQGILTRKTSQLEVAPGPLTKRPRLNETGDHAGGRMNAPNSSEFPETGVNVPSRTEYFVPLDQSNDGGPNTATSETQHDCQGNANIGLVSCGHRVNPGQLATQETVQDPGPDGPNLSSTSRPQAHSISASEIHSRVVRNDGVAPVSLDHSAVRQFELFPASENTRSSEGEGTSVLTIAQDASHHQPHSPQLDQSWDFGFWAVDGFWDEQPSI